MHTTLHPNRGFHGTLTTKISLQTTPAPDCTLHILYTFPPIAFIDPYELDLYSETYKFHYEGTRDLELPIMAVDQTKPGTLLLDVNLPETRSNEELELEVNVPLHFRYGEPSDKNGGEAVEKGILADPYGFIACPSQDDRVPSMPPVPVPHALPSSWKSLPPKHIYQLANMPPPMSSLDKHRSLEFEIPLGRKGDVARVEIGTALALMLCFCYLMRVTARTVNRMSERSSVRATITAERKD